jgi:hypothetical protein
MSSGLLDPWFVLELYATICRILLAIVILGVVAECVCILFLFIGERRQPRRILDRRVAPMFNNR